MLSASVWAEKREGQLKGGWLGRVISLKCHVCKCSSCLIGQHASNADYTVTCREIEADDRWSHIQMLLCSVHALYVHHLTTDVLNTLTV